MMSKEQLSGGYELSRDAAAELQRTAAETQQELAEQLKQKAEKAASEQEGSAEAAREAVSSALNEQEAVTEAVPEINKKAPAERIITKAHRKESFQKTMSAIQSQMSSPSRAFSKIIHNPAVEKVSDAAGRTIARPNAILAGSLAAFVLTLGIYLVARSRGYPLSGAETIAAFVLGWAIGLIIDYARVAYQGGRRR